MKSNFSNNPFQITSPEDLTAEEMAHLFVDVFTDFPKILDPGHIFLFGPRGSGKSMMFRYLMPDCQCQVKSCSISELPFLGIYVPLKNTNFALAELQRLEHRHASDILNTHIMVNHFCIIIFKMLADQTLYPLSSVDTAKTVEYFNDIFLAVLRDAYASPDNYSLGDVDSPSAVFLKMSSVCEKFYNNAMSYAKKLAFRNDLIPYDGPLCDFIDFLLPILNGLQEIDGLPKSPIYLLIDDAHWLSKTQKQVLNSWVATRTSRKVSLKISSQYNYNTFYTLTGSSIDPPHDFSEIDITTIYTGTRKANYRDRIADIVAKRLKIAGKSNLTADQFFPPDIEQEERIGAIAKEYKMKFDDGQGRGFYRTDDASRYARPDYIKSRAGQKKSSSTYSYAGFDQLVHLSSGIVRFFLHPAHKMYAETRSKDLQKEINFIPPSIQNSVVRQEADDFLFTDIERLQKEVHENAPPKEDILKLSNLIQGLGGLFRQILLSDRSERKVISIAFSDTPSDTVIRILDLGIQLGYFHKTTLGRKDSKSGGRTRLYVLNRRLAPIWNLDPTGFAGYLFVTNSLIEEALNKPHSLLRRIDREGLPEDVESIQLELF